MNINTTEMKHQARELARKLKQQIRDWHQSVRKWLENQKLPRWHRSK